MAKKATQSNYSQAPSFSYYHFTDGSKDFDKERTGLAPFIKVLNYSEITLSDLADSSHYGEAAGLYYIWKNENRDYIARLKELFGDKVEIV